jgi:hypothetical protein
MWSRLRRTDFKDDDLLAVWRFVRQRLLSRAAAVESRSYRSRIFLLVDARRTFGFGNEIRNAF